MICNYFYFIIVSLLCIIPWVITAAWIFQNFFVKQIGDSSHKICVKQL